MWKTGPTERIRGLRSVDPARSYRGRHGRRARALAALLDGGDDEVVVRPWEVRLPRTVILAAARSRGLEPVGVPGELARRGPWSDPMRFVRSDGAGSADPR